jgi:hypothetical protein
MGILMYELLIRTEVLDIHYWSMGILLYELLTGTLVLDIHYLSMGRASFCMSSSSERQC